MNTFLTRSYYLFLLTIFFEFGGNNGSKNILLPHDEMQFICIGTYKGLCLYDGTNLELY